MAPAAPQDAPPPNRIEAPSETLEALPVPAELPDALREVVVELAREGGQVDFERRRVIVRGVVLLDRMNAGYPIEYLLVTNGGAVHEALGMIRATPSRLNAAFIALGLEPGATIEYVPRDPLPPIEKLRSGEETEFDLRPPSGAVVDLLVEWEDDLGRHVHPIEDLLVYTTNRRTLPRRGFVYVGSRFRNVVIGVERQERFIADVEGNVVELHLKGLGHSLFDMNSIEGAEAHLYDVNADLCPPRGTRVNYIFQLR